MVLGTLSKGMGVEIMEPKGFIKEFKDFILEHVPTSNNWAENCAISILSVIAGPERYVLTRKGKLKLNTWFVIIGPSGIANKTLVLRDYVVPLLKKVGQKVGRDFILPSSFSMEGMVEYLTRNDRGIIILNEYGNFHS